MPSMWTFRRTRPCWAYLAGTPHTLVRTLDFVKVLQLALRQPNIKFHCSAGQQRVPLKHASSAVRSFKCPQP